MRYARFHLVLMVTHTCNLRCDYCYTGRKFPRDMPPEIGLAAIRRAVRSLQPGGTLELDFFGGEPLLKAGAISDWIDFASEQAAAAGITLRTGLTTNGTIDSPVAWDLMRRPELDLCISHDGLPKIHDRHRRCGPLPTAMTVLETIERLLAEGRELRVGMVVRPDTVAALPRGIEWLRACGVRQFDLTLDVWAQWDRAGLEGLETGLSRVADVWRQRLPDIAVNWLDEKAGRLLSLPAEDIARCRFGDGEIAVAPSGNLYPCERLIGEDADDNPMRLHGHVLQGDDFCRRGPSAEAAAECAPCAARQHCFTRCRCNNYVRTGDIGRPDALLCFLDRVCTREAARVLRPLVAPTPTRSVSEEEEPTITTGERS